MLRALVARNPPVGRALLFVSRTSGTTITAIGRVRLTTRHAYQPIIADGEGGNNEQIIGAFVPALVLGLASPTLAAKFTSDSRAVETIEAKPKSDSKAIDAVAVVESDASYIADKKQKKPIRLVGLLRASRNSGLLNVVAGHTGNGAVVSSVANTAIDVAAADASSRATAPEAEKPKC